jgi:hypothetical protein
MFGVRIFGGTPVPLSDAPIPGGYVREFGFTRGDPHLVYLADHAAVDVVELHAVEIGSGAVPIRLNAPLVPGGDVTSFRTSPDGTWTVYRADQNEDEHFELFAVPVDGSLPAAPLDSQRVIGDAQEDYAISAHGLLLFRADTGAALELFAVPLDGSRPPERLNSALVEGGDVADFRLSLDGWSVLYRADQELDDVLELYEMPLGRKVRAR